MHKIFGWRTYGSTISEKNKRLDQILERIRGAGLKLAPEKCDFLKQEVQCLSHVIHKDGVATDPKNKKLDIAKIQAGHSKESVTISGVL